MTFEQITQQQESRRSLYQRDDRRAVRRAHDQVTFPMTRHRPILDFCRTRTDRHDRAQQVAPSCCFKPGPRAAARAARSQTRQQFALQPTTALQIEAAVDRLGRHTHHLVVAMIKTQPCRHRSRRPRLLQSSRNGLGQLHRGHKLACFRASSTLRRSLVRLDRPIQAAAATTTNLTTDRRGRPMQPNPDHAERLTPRAPQRNHLPCSEVQAFTRHLTLQSSSTGSHSDRRVATTGGVDGHVKVLRSGQEKSLRW
jgi:hypothetical protein